MISTKTVIINYCNLFLFICYFVNKLLEKTQHAFSSEITQIRLSGSIAANMGLGVKLNNAISTKTTVKEAVSVKRYAC